MNKVVKVVNWVVCAALTVAAAFVVSATAVVLVASCFRANAAETNGQTVVETLLSDGTTNSWTQADLVAALGLLNRRYHRDIESESGRRAWHGKTVRYEVITNGADIAMRTTYEDGFVYDEAGKPPKPSVPRVRRTIPAYMTNGVPPRLAAARLAAFKNVKTVTTNVTLTVGGVIVKPRRVIQYDKYGVVTNVVTDGTIEKECVPSGIVTRVVLPSGEVATQKFVPDGRED